MREYIQQHPELNMNQGDYSKSTLTKADGIRRADGTSCHDSGSSSSVCVDGWFILGAMIAHAPQVCSPTQPESNQSDSGQVRL